MSEASTAQEWLDRWLSEHVFDKGEDEAARDLIAAAEMLPKKFQVLLHKEAVARLPQMRRDEADPRRWEKGSAVYALACRLYAANLPMTEADVCAILTTSKHDCGHGADVKPPLERAVAWARVHGVSEAWLGAVRTFVDGLAGLTSAKANDAKTKSALILLLDLRPAAKPGASDRFRRGLANLPADERRAWERLVLFMGTAMGGRIGKELKPQLENLVAYLGAAKVAARLDEWLPDPHREPSCKLDTAESHLFKNLVWLLVVLARDPAAAMLADPLVERLTRVELLPADRAKKVALACAVYFSTRSQEVGRGPLERILAWTEALEKNPGDSDGIRKIVASYRAQSAGA